MVGENEMKGNLGAMIFTNPKGEVHEVKVCCKRGANAKVVREIGPHHCLLMFDKRNNLELWVVCNLGYKAAAVGCRFETPQETADRRAKEAM